MNSPMKCGPWTFYVDGTTDSAPMGSPSDESNSVAASGAPTVVLSNGTIPRILLPKPDDKWNRLALVGMWVGITGFLLCSIIAVLRNNRTRARQMYSLPPRQQDDTDADQAHVVDSSVQSSYLELTGL